MTSCSNDKNNQLSFYSDKMFISKQILVEHQLKLTYQRQLISDLESKHKEWSRFVDFKF